MKKLALILAVAMFVTLLVPAFAAGGVTFAVDSASIPAGGKGTITVSISSNSGVAGFQGKLDFDQSKLKIVSAEALNVNGLVLTINPADGSFTGLSTKGNTTATGAVFKISLQATGDADKGDVLVSVSVTRCADIKRAAVASIVQAGKVTITEGNAKMSGDVTGDGKVDIMDVIRLLKYVSGWEVAIVSGNSEVTGDGDINIMDVIRLLKYVSGWEVELS